MAVALEVGNVVWLDYGEDPRVVHGRLLIEELDAQTNEWVSATPDRHVYPEIYDVAGNDDIDALYSSGPSSEIFPWGRLGPSIT